MGFLYLFLATSSTFPSSCSLPPLIAQPSESSTIEVSKFLGSLLTIGDDAVGGKVIPDVSGSRPVSRES